VRPAGMSFRSTKCVNDFLLLKQEVLRRTNRLLSFRYTLSIWYEKDRIQNTASNGSSIAACLFVAAGTCLPTRCLAPIRGAHRQQGELINILLFFKNKKSTLKKKVYLVERILRRVLIKYSV
jgi:hypothetical protein